MFAKHLKKKMFDKKMTDFFFLLINKKYHSLLLLLKKCLSLSFEKVRYIHVGLLRLKSAIILPKKKISAGKENHSLPSPSSMIQLAGPQMTKN